MSLPTDEDDPFTADLVRALTEPLDDVVHEADCRCGWALIHIWGLGRQPTCAEVASAHRQLFPMKK